MFWLYVYQLSLQLIYFDIILLIVISFYSPEGKASSQSPVDIAKRETNIPVLGRDIVSQVSQAIS